MFLTEDICNTDRITDNIATDDIFLFLVRLSNVLFLSTFESL